MNMLDVTVARVYLTEGHAQLESLLKRLHQLEKLRGVTVYRGIAGIGPSGELHTAKLVDLSLELPIVVEFFDTADKIAAAIDHLQPLIKPGHLLTWPAQVND